MGQISTREYKCSENISCKGFTELMLLTLSNDENIIKHKKDINAKNEKGWTALMLACRNNGIKFSIIKLLIEMGADVNAVNEDGWTALMMIARYKKDSIEVIDLLIQNGADLNIQNKEGYTALMLACHYCKTTNSCLDIVIKLLNEKADPNLENRYGETALFILCTTQNMKITNIIKALVEHNANVNIRDNRKKTLLHLMIKRDDKESLKIIINGGANLELMDDLGNTPLLDAIYDKKIEAIKILIKAGANINAKRKEWSGLMIACTYKLNDIIDLLIEKNASITDDDIALIRKDVKPEILVKLIQYRFNINTKNTIKNNMKRIVLKNIPKIINERKLVPGSKYIKFIGYAFEYRNDNDIEKLYTQIKEDTELVKYYDIDTVDKLRERLKDISMDNSI